MEQLSGQDASFLYNETPTIHTHTLKVAVLDLSEVKGGYSFERFREILGANLHRLPPFRRRLLEMPFGLWHPLWIEDPDFDIDRHISSRRASPPGDLEELCRIISEVASEPLKRDRPLWELVVVEGLQEGRLGIIGKIHHSVADGVASLELLMSVAMMEPSAEAPTAAGDHWEPDLIPSRWQLAGIALRAAILMFLRLPALFLRTIVGLVALGRHVRANEDVQAPIPFDAPITSWNTALSRGRVFAATSLPLGPILQIRKQLGVTVNDVVLALCSGALRRFLEERCELPERSLTVSVPTNTRTELQSRVGGNRVGNLIATLRTDVSDPIDRIRGIHTVMEDAKERHRVLGSDMLESWIEFMPPRPTAAAMRLWSRLRLSDRIQPPTNLIVSNVRGPSEPVKIAGGKLVQLYSVGPIIDGMALNLTAWSYVDELHVSMISCPENIPDPWRLMGHFEAALDELSGAAEVVSQGAGG